MQAPHAFRTERKPAQETSPSATGRETSYIKRGRFLPADVFSGTHMAGRTAGYVRAHAAWQGSTGSFNESPHCMLNTENKLFIFYSLAAYPVPLKPLIQVFTHNHKTAEYEHVDYKQLLKILDSETILEKLKNELRFHEEHNRPTSYTPLLTLSIPLLHSGHNMKNTILKDVTILLDTDNSSLPIANSPTSCIIFLETLPLFSSSSI